MLLGTMGLALWSLLEVRAQCANSHLIRVKGNGSTFVTCLSLFPSPSPFLSFFSSSFFFSRTTRTNHPEFQTCRGTSALRYVS